MFLLPRGCSCSPPRSVRDLDRQRRTARRVARHRRADPLRRAAAPSRQRSSGSSPAGSTRGRRTALDAEIAEGAGELGLLQPGQLLADRHRRAARRSPGSGWRSSQSGCWSLGLVGDPVHGRRAAVRVLHARPHLADLLGPRRCRPGPGGLTRPATWDQVLARRVRAPTHLDAPATDGLVSLVRRLCGVHAQLGLGRGGRDLVAHRWERCGAGPTCGGR